MKRQVYIESETISTDEKYGFPKDTSFWEPLWSIVFKEGCQTRNSLLVRRGRSCETVGSKTDEQWESPWHRDTCVYDRFNGRYYCMDGDTVI